MLSKEFQNASHELYYGVAKGYELVNLKNFVEVYKLLPSSEKMLEDKDVFAESLLKLLVSCDPSLNFGERDYAKFSEDPLDFNKKLLPNSQSDTNLKDVKALMALVNDLYGNYSVSTRIINFLVDRCNQNVNINKELSKKYMLALTKLNEYESLKEVESFNIGVMPKIQENPLILTEKEVEEQKNEPLIETKQETEEDDQRELEETPKIDEESE